MGNLESSSRHKYSLYSNVSPKFEASSAIAVGQGAPANFFKVS
jgi:hypothetical protein